MRKPVFAICEQQRRDEPAHPCSLISVFVVHCLDRRISLVFISEIPSLYLASVAAQAGLSLIWSQTPKTGFLLTGLKWKALMLFAHTLILSIPLDKDLFEPRHDKINKMVGRPAKTQISLGIRLVWSESSLSAWRNLGSLATHWAHSEDSDQTGRMLRLIWIFAERTLILLVLSCRGSF